MSPVAMLVAPDTVWASAVAVLGLSLIHLSEPTRLLSIAYAVFCLRNKLARIRCSSQVEPGDFTADLTHRLRTLSYQ